MAEATALRNNALPYPVYSCPFTVVFPAFDADGDLSAMATPDCEISKNGDTFADCTNEATEIATSSGMHYLTLTGTELTCDIAAIIAKSATAGMKTTPIVLYPRKLVTLASGTSQGGDTGYITLAAGTITYDDQYNGCLCVATIDSVVEARILQDCTASNQQCTVTPAWNTAPDSNDTYSIKLPEGMAVPMTNVIRVTGTAQTARDLGASVLLSSGTGTGQLDFTSGVVKANLAQILGTALTETSGQIAAAFKKFFDKGSPTGTINSLPDAVAGATGGVFIAGTNAATTVTTALTTTFTGNLTGSVASVTGAVGSVAANGITATSIAADAINAAAVKADAVTKIQTGLATPTNITAGTITTATSVTNGVTLADDAITAAKFDESTAFPLKATDSGSTYVARTGADSDTLEVLSDEIAAVSTLIGTPANIDSGGATLADNLKKIADDNGGASFDATVSSLNKLSTAVVTGVAATLQATANTETTGTLISGTYASTYLSNGTSWVTAPVTPAVAEAGSALSPFGLNANLFYTAGTGQTINSVSVRGNFAAGPGRYVNVYAYNYADSVWDMLSDVGTRMNSSATLTTYTYTLLAAHQKTTSGGDGVGAIRIGFKSPSTNTGDRLNVDLALVNVATAGASAADIADAVYAKLATSIYGRQVWIDTVNGVDGYVIGVNGLDHAPVLTIACAYQLCDDLGLRTIAFKAGSNAVAVTLTRSAAGWRFYGPGKIALNGQSIADAIFDECYSVYGTSMGDDASFYRCQIGSGGLTLDHVYITDCRIKGAITLIANADPTIFHGCIDATGAGADFELIFVANATAVIRDFQGAITLKGMAATNSLVIDGALRITIDASCTAGSITIQGFAPALTGAVAFIAAGGTITQDARYATDVINAEAVDAAHDEVIEGALTQREITRITLAVLAGKSGGGGTTTDTFRDVADSKDRVSATVNNLGNRTAVTLDGS